MRPRSERAVTSCWRFLPLFLTMSPVQVLNYRRTDGERCSGAGVEHEAEERGVSERGSKVTGRCGVLEIASHPEKLPSCSSIHRTFIKWL